MGTKKFSPRQKLTKTNIAKVPTGKPIVYKLKNTAGTTVYTGKAKRLRPNTVSRAFEKLARSLGLKMRFHDLRHAHATLMLRQGVHPKIVSERLGHSSVAITLDIYSHVLPGLQEAAAHQFEEGLQDTVPDIRVTEVG